MLAHLCMNTPMSERAERERELKNKQRSQLWMSPLNNLSFPSVGPTYCQPMGPALPQATARVGRPRPWVGSLLDPRPSPCCWPDIFSGSMFWFLFFWTKLIPGTSVPVTELFFILFLASFLSFLPEFWELEFCLMPSAASVNWSPFLEPWPCWGRRRPYSLPLGPLMLDACSAGLCPSAQEVPHSLPISRPALGIVAYSIPGPVIAGPTAPPRWFYSPGWAWVLLSSHLNTYHLEKSVGNRGHQHSRILCLEIRPDSPISFIIFPCPATHGINEPCGGLI